MKKQLHAHKLKVDLYQSLCSVLYFFTNGQNECVCTHSVFQVSFPPPLGLNAVWEKLWEGKVTPSRGSLSHKAIEEAASGCGLDRALSVHDSPQRGKEQGSMRSSRYCAHPPLWGLGVAGGSTCPHWQLA